MRGKSEDQSVGAEATRKSPRPRPTTERELARESTLVNSCGRALAALLWFGFCSSACSSSVLDRSAPSGEHSCSASFATSVESFSPGPGPSFGRANLPGVVLGPPKGAGPINGSLDVVTLGNGGSITLGFAPNSIVDGPGPDFIVFENAFYAGGDPNAPYAELASVEVSDDGQQFEAFPCIASAAPYGDCAGYHPVYANPDSNSIDATDPSVAGGDGFDLAELGMTRARYVRITDRVDLTGTDGTFDLDAVSIVNAECP